MIYLGSKDKPFKKCHDIKIMMDRTKKHIAQKNTLIICLSTKINTEYISTCPTKGQI